MRGAQGRPRNTCISGPVASHSHISRLQSDADRTFHNNGSELAPTVLCRPYPDK